MIAPPKVQRFATFSYRVEFSDDSPFNVGTGVMVSIGSHIGQTLIAHLEIEGHQLLRAGFVVETHREGSRTKRPLTVSPLPTSSPPEKED